MAARKNKGTFDKPWDDKVRAKIKTSMLINRLNNHIFDDAVISLTQMKAIEILLRKSLPDLSTVTLEGGANPIQLQTLARTIVDPNPDG